MKTKKGNKKGLVVGILAVFVVAVIGVIGYMGAQGDWFQGMSFFKSRTSSVTQVTKVPATTTTTQLAPVNITVTTPPNVVYRFLDRTGGIGGLENLIYEASEPGLQNDVVMVFELENKGGGYAELDSLTVNTTPLQYTNCSTTAGIINSKTKTCDLEDIPVAVGGSLVMLNKDANNYTLINRDADKNGVFIPINKSWTGLKAGEKKTFAIFNDTRAWASYGKNHSIGKTNIIRTLTTLKDANGNAVTLNFDSASMLPKTILFH